MKKGENFFLLLLNLFISRIGVAEKGYLTIKLEVHGEPGHASAIPYESPIVILTKAVSK